MSCKDVDRKYSCGSKMNARCVTYDGTIPDCSDLSAVTCITVEDTITNTYEMLCAVSDETDLTALGNDCIDYEEAVPGDIKVNEALLKHEELLCEIQAAAVVASNCPIDISCMTLDTSCLVDACATGFDNLEDLLQAMINKICEV